MASGRGMPGPAPPKLRLQRVDRCWSNPRRDREAARADLLRLVGMDRQVVRGIVDGMDGPEGHPSLVAAIGTGHRRALPIAAETVATGDRTVRQNAIVRAFRQRVRRIFPAGCRPRLLADRGGCRGEGLAAAEVLGWRAGIRLTGDRGMAPPDDTGILHDLPARRGRWGDWS